MSVSDANRIRALEARIAALESRFDIARDKVPELIERVHKMTLEMRLVRGGLAALRVKVGMPARAAETEGLESDAA